jgi:hypothetical protein
MNEPPTALIVKIVRLTRLCLCVYHCGYDPSL